MLSNTDRKFVRKLHNKKFRTIHQQYIVEGKKLLNEACKTNTVITRIFAIKSWATDNENLIKHYPSQQIVVVNQKELKQISQLKTPDAVLAVIDMPTNKYELKFEQLTICLDRMSDPGNLGTILRIADWFGVDQIVCSKDTVGVYNSKVVQATMGAIFRVPVFYEDLTSFFTRYAEKYPLYIADLNGEDALKSKYDFPSMLLIGNESEGVKSDLKPFSQAQIMINKNGMAESLNAAVSCGIICAAMSAQINR